MSQTAGGGTRQMAGQWQVVLRKLDPDDQTVLLETITAEKEAVAAEKDAEIAALQANLARALRGLSSQNDGPEGGKGERSGRRRRLAVSGDSYTALSSLYSSTAGVSWYTKTNWMSGDPCASSWWVVPTIDTCSF